MCAAIGTKLNFSWQSPEKNDLQPVQTSRLDEFHEANFTFDRVTRQQNGSYICSATNDVGSDKAVVILRVLGKIFQSRKRMYQHKQQGAHLFMIIVHIRLFLPGLTLHYL